MGHCVTFEEQFDTSQRASIGSEKSDFGRRGADYVDDLADSPIVTFISWIVGAV